MSGVLLLAGIAYLLSAKKLTDFVWSEARGLAAVTAVGWMLAVGGLRL